MSEPRNRRKTAQLAAPASSAAAALTPPRPWLWRTPGVVFYAAFAFAVLMAFWLNTIQSHVGQWATVVAWSSIAGIWVVRIAVAARGSIRLSFAEWIRWLAIPAIFGIAGPVIWSGAPVDVRLSLGRAAMDQAAAEVTAGDTTERQWIGH